MSQVSPRQIRAARALLDWSQADLADRAVVSRASIQRLEKGLGSTTDVYFKVVRALEGQGIEFQPASPTRGEGVNLALPTA